MPKIGIIYSSFNNYGLLDECLKTIKFEGYPVVNIDDYSSKEDAEFGKKVCKKHNIPFIKNTKKGVQFAVDEGIKILKKQYGVEWIFCCQQDIFPLTENFFSKFEKIVDEYKIENVGAMGFNVLDDDIDGYCLNALQDYKQGLKVNGWLGVFFLSDSKYDIFRIPFLKWVKEYARSIIKRVRRRFFIEYRVFSPRSFNNFNAIVNKYKGVFSIELPMWAFIAINVRHWEENITPDEDYIFQGWFPDIAMQFLSSNIEIAVASDLYLLNRQSLKENYGMNRSSAYSSSQYHEKLGRNFEVFINKWGFGYEDSRSSYCLVRQRYTDTLVDKYYNHDCRKGPLKVYEKI